jgi:DNA-binding CsgD family transcriptional regulator
MQPVNIDMTRQPKGEQTAVLTSRERQVAALVARGFANKAIADELSISRWTVAAHLRRIYTRLGVSTRAQMVAVLLLDEVLSVRTNFDSAS